MPSRSPLLADDGVREKESPCSVKVTDWRAPGGNRLLSYRLPASCRLLPSCRALGLAGGVAVPRRLLSLPLVLLLLALLYALALRGGGAPRWPAAEDATEAPAVAVDAPDPQRLLDLLPVSADDPRLLPEMAERIILAKPPYVRPAEPKRDFEGFNNVTGLNATADFLVPNFVHFLRFEEVEFDFIDFVVVLSAMRNQRPERLFFHTNVRRFRGELWDRLLVTPGFADVAEFVHWDLPSEIFGQPMDNGYRVWHAGDITRIRILMKYGGIFLDNDSYMVKSLDGFRRFEMALGWFDPGDLGTQVLVAHPDARFLKLWLESYRGTYDKDKWYYNAGQLPTAQILNKKPELVHRVKKLFGIHWLAHVLFKANEIWPDWRDFYTVHVLKRWQDKDFTKDNFLQPPTTIRDMILDVYDPATGRARLV